MQKKKILFLTEASFLSTGYAVYGREIMKRLHKTGKYEIAELGCYGHVAPMPNEIEAFIRINGVPRMFDIPWTYYGNIPSESEEEAQVYNSNMTNQYGEWRFERVCLDFKPDVVCDFRDFWMHEYVQRSPYRNYFSFAVMPTVDSAPLQEQWLYTYSKADAVLAYSEYGEKVLKDSTNGTLKFAGIASPAANPDIFKPVIDKEAHKAKMGFESGVKIIGTVMRNQGRKLYPDLFDLFSRIKQDNVYLYCHTCHPDIGWDIPYFLKYFDIGNKVLFTYKCFNCGHVFPGFFNDGKRTCPNCHTVAAKMPNTHNGISDAELAAIYNLFDFYVQYSNCEGFGMPVVEAAFCGVPTAVVNYSAMESFVENIDSIPLPVERMFWDTGTCALRALPDNKKCYEMISEIIQMPTFLLRRKGMLQRNKAVARYSYDNSAKVWSDTFDKLSNGKWNEAPRIAEPNLNVPPNLDNESFINWCIANILCEPERINSFEAMKWLKDLNYGEAVKGTSEIIFNEASFVTSNQRHMKFTHKEFVENLVRMAEKRNYYEGLRAGLVKEAIPYYIVRKKVSQ